MESIWLSFAKRLHALSSTGLAYGCNEYDRERFEEIQAIATEMMSLLGRVNIESVQELLTEHTKGYATPKIDVRGAVFHENRVLLVQEKSNELWTLPGGFADVGLSAAENIEKEIEEEAGLKVAARSIFSVRHKAKGDYLPDVRDFYKLFFLCESRNGPDLSPGGEILNAGYFDKHEIPDLCTGRILVEDLNRAWEFNENLINTVYFD